MTRFDIAKYTLFMLLLGVLTVIANTVPPPVGV